MTRLCFVISLLLLQVMVLAQAKAKIKSFTYGDCDHTCDGEKFTSVAWSNNSLSVKLVQQVMCGSTFYVEVLKCDADTLRLNVNTDKVGFQAGSKQSIVGSNLCRCYYRLELKLDNVKQLPKYWVLNDRIHHSFLGLVSLEDYGRSYYKTFEDNTSAISYEDLTSVLGDKMNSPGVNAMCKKLGNDSLYFDYDGEVSLEFPADHVIVAQSYQGKVKQVFIRDNFKGKLPKGIGFDKKPSEIEAILGTPNNKEFHYSGYEPDSKSGYISRMDYYNYNLSVHFNDTGKIQYIVFSN